MRLKGPVRQEFRVAILAELGESPDQWLSRWRRLRGQLSQKFRSASSTLADLFEAQSTSNLVAAGTSQGALMFGAVAPSLNQDDLFQLAELLLGHSLQASSEDKLAPYPGHRPPKSTLSTAWMEERPARPRMGKKSVR